MVAFSEVCKDALSFGEKTEEEITQLDKKIREMYTAIPEALRTRSLSESIADASFLIMTRLYVEFIYLKCLCVLHRRYMAQGNDFSTRCCIEAGSRLVSQFIDIYKELSPGGQLHMSRWMLTSFTMNDFLLGVMVLCLVVHTGRRRSSGSSAIDFDTESTVLELLKQSHSICVEKSAQSRDARRVSHVVRLTLNTGRSEDVALVKAASHPSLPTHVLSSDLRLTDDETPDIDFQYLSLPPWHGFSQDDQEAFGLFDPLHFMSNDFETHGLECIEP